MSVPRHPRMARLPPVTSVCRPIGVLGFFAGARRVVVLTTGSFSRSPRIRGATLPQGKLMRRGFRRT
jgi:hypothetical protein